MQSHIPTREAVNALAFIGDLSMGQPTDHSLRTAWLAQQLALASGRSAPYAQDLHDVAMLRWSGCTANAPEVAEFLGDDVIGRQDMLAARQNGGMPSPVPSSAPPSVLAMMQIHCDVSGAIAGMLELGAPVEAALRSIFRRYDGHGPREAAGPVPPMVFEVAIASDLEIFSRSYDTAHALKVMRAMAGMQYPAALVDIAIDHADEWLQRLSDGGALAAREQAAAAGRTGTAGVALEVIADVVDLKLPWMTGLSRRVARSAEACAAALGLDAAAQRRVYQAGLIHGIGRAAVPNALWDSSAPLLAGDWERMRLVPYWTARAGRQSRQILLSS